MTGLKVVPFLAPEMSIRRAHLLYRGNILELLERSAAEAAGPATRAAGGDRSAAELLSRILEYSVVARASDIHIEPYEVETLVRCRIDGVLKEVLSVAPAAHASLVARVKILASMRIDERRVPQDGRLELDLSGLRMDIRVSSIPTARGEKIVLRLLSKEAAFVDLEELGLAASDYDTLRANLLRPFGMILVTGPTGSGKSTSLYAMLTRLGIERQHALNISTIEDPIEYTMPRVSQMAVNTAAGLEFADGLRALLRQDPDVIMVGEIRDRETADIGVRAALVGRLFLSTLHTNDSTGAVARLLDMGIEPFLLASTLVMVLAQRLVRRICMACRESFDGDATRARRAAGTPGFRSHARRAPAARGYWASPTTSPAACACSAGGAVRSARARDSAGAWASSRCSRSTTTPPDDHGAARRRGHPRGRHRGGHEDHVPGRPRQGAPRRHDAGRSISRGARSRSSASGRSRAAVPYRRPAGL